MTYVRLEGLICSNHNSANSPAIQNHNSPSLLYDSCARLFPATTQSDTHEKRKLKAANAGDADLHTQGGVILSIMSISWQSRNPGQSGPPLLLSSSGLRNEPNLSSQSDELFRSLSLGILLVAGTTTWTSSSTNSPIIGRTENRMYRLCWLSHPVSSGLSRLN